MKKKVFLIILLMFIFTGCGKKDNTNIIEKLQNKINGLNSYSIDGNLDIYAPEETFSYKINVGYLKDDYYKVDMINKNNNHEQIILKNKDAVYVITPSLNKSYKFESNWPNNSSQLYILSTIINDIKDGEIEKVDNTYIIKTKASFPNNPNLVKEIITLDKDLNLKSNEVYDKDDNLKMKFTVVNLDYKANYKEKDFKLENYIKEEVKEDNKNKIDNCDSDSNCQKENNKKTGVIDNILYPLYIPSNTYLTNSDTVDTENGNRHILTFSGDKNFVLVEETLKPSDEFEVIPVYGEIELINDKLGIINDTSLTWDNDNISYYLASSDINGSELLKLGESIGYNNKIVSFEK